MADLFNPSRIGQVNQANSVTALFLKIFAGEVLTAFEMACVTEGRTLSRTIQYGKSASFPVIGGISAEYHTPGTELVGLNVNHNEAVITIDGILVSHAFIYDLDEAMNHYDVRSPYSTNMGRKLAYQKDEDVFSELILAARASAYVSDGDAGTIVTDANLGSATLATKADALGKALYSAAQALDEHNAPEERYAAFLPAEYHTLVQAVQSNGFSAIHQLFGGKGSYADGNVVSIAGIQILKSNNVPHTDLSDKTYHGVDAATTKGIVWTPDAVGTVKLMDLALRVDYIPERLGNLMVAKYAMGHGILTPACAVELRTGAP
jgi:hypothetical protein